jgi:hypothetical protein
MELFAEVPSGDESKALSVQLNGIVLVFIRATLFHQHLDKTPS